ncbi:MAG: alcohol dehydrogenase catalytic domain-containing protein [Arcobacter sp.]|nr:alcohol dehydrogenase catalytic domain-containing protein [Arcobacter sp.]
MKALFLEKQKTLSIKEVNTPIETNDNVLIDIEVTGIGGSEYLGFNNPGIRSLPNIMGHSICGTTENGTRVAVYPLLSCNKCNYCKNNQSQLCDNWSLIGVQSNGGFAQKVLVPNKSLIEIPNGLSWEQSAFIEPFANSINAWEISKATNEDNIAIIGAGSLGLGIVTCANNINCKNINIIDLSDNRLASAKQLGATKVTKNFNDNLQFDIVFDTVGSIESRNLAISITKKNAKCIFLGFEAPIQNINFSELIRYQKQLIGSFVYTKEQFKKAMKLVQNCDNKWVKNLSFLEVEEQLNKYLEKDFSTIKAVLRPNK